MNVDRNDWIHLPKIDKATALKKTVLSVLIMMGSNQNTAINFQLVYAEFAEWGDCQYSNKITSQDYTKKSNDYDNQAVVIKLKNKVLMAEIRQRLKKLELITGRDLALAKTKGIVPLDLDILAIQCDEKNSNTLQDLNKNNQQNRWYLINERYPFKSHELTVLNTFTVGIFE